MSVELNGVHYKRNSAFLKRGMVPFDKEEERRWSGAGIQYCELVLGGQVSTYLAYEMSDDYKLTPISVFSFPLGKSWAPRK